jgi:hypothetical protein
LECHARSWAVCRPHLDLLSHSSILLIASDGLETNPARGWELPCFVSHAAATIQYFGRMGLFNRLTKPRNAAGASLVGGGEVVLAVMSTNFLINP